MPISVITPPVAEPITVDQAKDWLKIDFDNDDEMIAMLISAAREKAEHYCNARFVTTTVKETFSPSSIMVTTAVGPNVAGIVVGSDGETLVLGTDYTVKTDDRQTLIHVLNRQEEALEVTYTAGYGTANDVPTAIKQAILLTVSDYYENRVDAVRSLPTASAHLLNAYRRWTS